jgi:hypothetical protein
MNSRMLTTLRDHPCFLAWATIIGLALRLASAWLWPAVGDVANYRLVAERLAAGGRLYTATAFIYPYPPVWAAVEMIALWLAQQTAAPFAFWVKLPIILAELGIVALIARMSTSSVPAATYALSPVAITISALHGQFDSLPLLLVLMALVLARRRYHLVWPALALMAAIALKSFPVLFLPLFLFRLPTVRQRIVFSSVVLAPVAGLLLPFLLADASAVRRELFGYGGVIDHGYGVALYALTFLPPEYFLTQDETVVYAMVSAAGRNLFLIVYGVILLLCYRMRALRSLTDDVLLVILAFYALYPGISSQYLLWALPFLLLTGTRAALGYTAVATMALIAFYARGWPQFLSTTTATLLAVHISNLLRVTTTSLWWGTVTHWLALRLVHLCQPAPGLADPDRESSVR